MAYERLLSRHPADAAINLHTTIGFLARHFGALQIKHSLYNNLLLLDGRTWWVIPATSKHGISFAEQINNQAQDELKKLRAGILILRQMPDNQLCIYLIDRLENIEAYCNPAKILLWVNIEKLTFFSDRGIVVENGLMGFRKLGNKLKAPVIPIKPRLLKVKGSP